RVTWPLFVAAWAVLASGLAAVNSTANLADQILITNVLLIAGLCCSMVLRLLRLDLNWIIGLIVAIVILFLGNNYARYGSPLPLDAAGTTLSPDLGLATLMAWVAIFYSYTLVTDGLLLATVVPTLAVMGLVGT